uniref:Uncharacterized protein n=1 Tax=Parascaris univalens TaxID=6257 RepID=A0A915AGI4_PARUN
MPGRSLALTSRVLLEIQAQIPEIMLRVFSRSCPRIFQSAVSTVVPIIPPLFTTFIINDVSNSGTSGDCTINCSNADNKP